MANASTADQHRPQQNALLAALSSAECERVAHDLELVPLALGQVLDRRGVEKRSCECYAVVKQESDRLLPLSVEIGH